MVKNGFERLKEIGAEKIREATNLDIGRIEDILEKRFEKIVPVRAKGFIQMLEKEFHLDLSSWLEEYNQFHSHQSPKEEKREKIQQITQEKNNAMFWSACVGLLLVGGGILYWISKPSSHSLSTEVAKQEQTQKLQTQQPQEEVMTEVVVAEEIPQAPQEEAKPQEAQQQIQAKEIDEYGESVFPQVAYNEENILFITAKSPLWVGIINLDTKKRVAKTKTEFEIPLDKQLLINIARGGFDASLDDEEIYFNTYKPVYLIHTIKGGLKQITKEEFMYLNGGVEW